jgi:hypothetical protein
MNAVHADVNVNAPYTVVKSTIYIYICIYSVHRSSDIGQVHLGIVGA